MGSPRAHRLNQCLIGGVRVSSSNAPCPVRAAVGSVLVWSLTGAVPLHIAWSLRLKPSSISLGVLQCTFCKH